MSAPDPSPSVPAIQTAARLLAEGRPGEAAARLAALVAEAPTYAAAHVLLATALEAAGHIDGALVAWGRAAALVPRSPLVHRERERLLATHVASERPVDLPPPVPAEPVAEAPVWEDAEDEPTVEELAAQTVPDTPLLDDDGDVDLAPDAEEDADEPLLDFGAPPPPPEIHPLVDAEPQPFDASDLVFGAPAAAPRPAVEEAPPDERPAEPEPEAPEAAGPRGEGAVTSAGGAPPLSPLSPIAADWGADETGLAAVVPPEGDLPPLSELPPSPPSGAGWEVLSESTVPTPPPGTYAEPDIVAPEDRDEAPPTDDPFSDVDAVVDEFGAPPDETPVSGAPRADRSVADELDALIAQLEDAPRIRPDPEYRGPEVALDAGDVDDMVSETLAKIYAAQHQYVEAALMYEKLAARQPQDAAALLERAAELRQRGG